ncbi:putative organophosphate acid anhydrase protein [Phaeoacremonium minimum UCRPA7]|uniref:Putative organophosphate acid anhydrase protein n=1 Tax=Phaeoacremonium minimum (strain UCR-PA7) TaxID=1286976 RepID=R8BAY0_PHAM7|nr:putative organophosphate acid anhydrase protein [Phaeoacremonium minimum UCRPA7]EON96441.1 putative organophosphate acid anhydrase protein [Phaeoacremonium minimum UCRPA7]
MATTAITNVRLFDGENEHSPTTVVLSGPVIQGIGVPIPADATVIDGTNCTLLPGLIDAHTHTKIPQLKLALTFGVTTELEMMGYWTPEQRAEVASRDDIADLRSASFGLTPPGGHPSELHGPRGGKGKDGPPAGKPPGSGPPHTHGHGHDHGHKGGEGKRQGIKAPNASNPHEAVAFVQARIEEGADYIKIMIEEGSVLKAPGLPVPSNDTILAAVHEVHRREKMAIAHILTYDTAEIAIDAGMDGLAHIFIDRPADESFIHKAKAAGTFITPCLCLNASIMGLPPASLASDERVSSKLSQEWLSTLKSSFNTYPAGDFNVVLKTVGDLHKAGIDILAGTDASVPMPHLGGLAHGASVHHELQLLVQAGLTTVDALKAATSVPARRFGLKDRGHVKEGLRADLLLVEGNPTINISDTLSIKGVWKRGVRLDQN